METKSKKDLFTLDDFKKEVLKDYKTLLISRECSILGRKEVLMGRGKFGIFGDGKELPQLVMAKFFKNGDFRSGYYRDQTFMMSIDKLSIENLFSAIYGNTEENLEPMSSGRQMNGHYVTRSVDENGDWLDLTSQKNSSADISCTAGQMPRLLGLAQASKVYRKNKEITSEKFSIKGNEIAWGTIGEASTSEGVFFEVLNAAGVMQVPMVISIWDDSYGISVHKKYQTIKESISDLLKGFERDEMYSGFEIILVKGWDYSALLEAYQRAETIARESHIPVIIHVSELTQPQGHSTSGSHERYKSKKRLDWEKEYDCLRKFKLWILENNITTEEILDTIHTEAKEQVKSVKKIAWGKYINGLIKERDIVIFKTETILKDNKLSNQNVILLELNKLKLIKQPIRKDIFHFLYTTIINLALDAYLPEIAEYKKWYKEYFLEIQDKYSSNLYSESKYNPVIQKITLPIYNDDAKEVDARIILRDNFDKILQKNKLVLIFGEDSGKIGDVNQGLETLQEKYGEDRVFDTGIREASIIGQGIGLALRGLRPIAEIQYLDYLTYALYTLSDDLASLSYRTNARQKAPLIIRTRGHRLEGIFHSGSPMGGIINYLRGIYVLVPRNMTKAAGFYNLLLESDQPALVVESLNSYRKKELYPENIGEFKTPVGEIEVTRRGTDITIVSYGSTLHIVHEAVDVLKKYSILCEVIDIQSLIPFDLNFDILKSIQKTNRLLIVDEDVPGGASAYILHQILDNQKAFQHLDSSPETLTAKAHRPAYGTDGDYFSKPNKENVFEKVYTIMNEFSPEKFPSLY